MDDKVEFKITFRLWQNTLLKVWSRDIVPTIPLSRNYIKGGIGYKLSAQRLGGQPQLMIG